MHLWLCRVTQPPIQQASYCLPYGASLIVSSQLPWLGICEFSLIVMQVQDNCLGNESWFVFLIHRLWSLSWFWQQRQFYSLDCTSISELKTPCLYLSVSFLLCIASWSINRFTRSLFSSSCLRTVIVHKAKPNPLKEKGENGIGFSFLLFLSLSYRFSDHRLWTIWCIIVKPIGTPNL